MKEIKGGMNFFSSITRTAQTDGFLPVILNLADPLQCSVRKLTEIHWLVISILPKFMYKNLMHSFRTLWSLVLLGEKIIQEQACHLYETQLFCVSFYTTNNKCNIITSNGSTHTLQIVPKLTSIKMWKGENFNHM